MIFTRGIARTAGRALAVRRANAALFGTSSIAPKSAPIFNQGLNASRKSGRTNLPAVNGTVSRTIDFFFLIFYFFIIFV